MRAEDIKDWHSGILMEENTGEAGPGDNWRLLVQLIQIIWERGEIPSQMKWVIVILIPKGKGDFRGIGLLEPVWKVIEIIIDGRLQAIQLHDCLHGFMKGRGTGTATIEAKLTQQLAHLEQTPLYEIFVDLRKAYDSVDRARCLKILAGYGVGRKVSGLLQHFWASAEYVCKAGGYFGRRRFKTGRGVTQGGPASPRIFNIVVDAVLREWLRHGLGKRAAAEGMLRYVRMFLPGFYADDGLLQSRCPTMLQDSFNSLVALFERVGLKTNTSKTKAMVCVPGKIRTRLLKEVYTNARVGLKGKTGWKGASVACDHCGKSVATGLLRSHLET